MPSDHSQSIIDRRSGEPGVLRSQVDAIAWALFFIWVGVAILADIGWGWFLIGIGVIVLGAQLALSRSDEAVDGAWIVIGTVFLAGGIWQVLGITWPLAPVLLILLGGAMLFRALFSQPDSRH